MREFNSLFSFLARKYDPSRVFDDFLTLVICCLARQTQEDWYHTTIRKYDEDEFGKFSQLLAQLLIYYRDPLGAYYEALSGSYKKSSFGQFFTPAALCEMTARMTVPKGTFGKDILEPACGSGRMILALNNYCPGNHYTAQDLDHICVKMTCINLAFHGVKATVHHMDALGQKPPFNSYEINADFHTSKTPLILKFKRR